MIRKPLAVISSKRPGPWPRPASWQPGSGCRIADRAASAQVRGAAAGGVLCRAETRAPRIPADRSDGRAWPAKRPGGGPVDRAGGLPAHRRPRGRDRASDRADRSGRPSEWSREELRSRTKDAAPPSCWVSRETCRQLYLELLEMFADLGFRACVAFSGHWPGDYLLSEMQKELGGEVRGMRFWGGGTVSLLANHWPKWTGTATDRRARHDVGDVPGHGHQRALDRPVPRGRHQGQPTEPSTQGPVRGATPSHRDRQCRLWPRDARSGSPASGQIAQELLKRKLAPEPSGIGFLPVNNVNGKDGQDAYPTSEHNHESPTSTPLPCSRVCPVRCSGRWASSQLPYFVDEVLPVAAADPSVETVARGLAGRRHTLEIAGGSDASLAAVSRAPAAAGGHGRVTWDYGSSSSRALSPASGTGADRQRPSLAWLTAGNSCQSPMRGLYHFAAIRAGRQRELRHAAARQVSDVAFARLFLWFTRTWNARLKCQPVRNDRVGVSGDPVSTLKENCTVSDTHATQQQSTRSHNFSRRSFLAGASAAAVGVTILRPELVRGYQANEKVAIGLVGCGGLGTWTAELFPKHGGYVVAGGAADAGILSASRSSMPTTSGSPSARGSSTATERNPKGSSTECSARTACSNKSVLPHRARTSAKSHQVTR